MTKRKTFLLLAAAVIFGTACSLTSGAALLSNEPGTATGTPTAAQTDQLTPTPLLSLQRCTVTAYYLNLRACSGTHCDVIEVLEEGDALQVIERGDWLKVETKAGAVGFVNSKYCTLNRE